VASTVLQTSPEGGIRYRSAAGRWVIATTVLGSGMAFLDGTVVNVALPTIGKDFGASVDGLQWIVNGYLLTLAALILLGGALGDRYGRRRVFLIGAVWFAAASLLCGLAPSLQLLVLARVLQGVGGALLAPGSLAIIESSFQPDDRSQAIGAWSGLGGAATAIGPLLGGWLIQAVSWRLIFLINLPFAVAVVAIALVHVPESRDASAPPHLDLAGALLAAVGLTGVTYALIEAPNLGLASPLILAAASVGVLALVAFVIVELRSPNPMLPLDIFRSRQFTGANVTTFAVYAALSATFFLLILQLQQVLGYSPLAAGTATFPVTLLMLVLSPRAGRLASRIGPRLPMTVGPLVAALGMVLLARIGPGSSYVVDILPALVVFGLGLSLTVAPLTATVMAAAEARHAGIASAVNNAVARVAGLIAVAVVPLVAGVTGAAYLDPALFSTGFHAGMLFSAAVTAVGGLVAWLSIRDPLTPEPTPDEGAHCPIHAPPLRRRAVAASVTDAQSLRRVLTAVTA
jgi:EmrB/QacA subfamily drug resistance transporter